ncbi:unnamed protein product [Coffea canephora]|uniref:Thymidine kinase n=1 Tax=Coffea canephora TaxID=49390 RepID=A0A068VIV8_COFCA|nr:unnamed protein product [Coffea canephora]
MRELRSYQLNEDLACVLKDMGYIPHAKSIAVIKSDKYTRYALHSIVTHDGEKLPFRQKLGSEAYDKACPIEIELLKVIGIDEAQFFEDLCDFYLEAADYDGKVVIDAVDWMVTI